MKFTSQSRLNFDIDTLVRLGIVDAYVTPFKKNNEALVLPEIIIRNLVELAGKAKEAKKSELNVYPFFVTINHPEGNFDVPDRYRRQKNIDGSERFGQICFKDAVRQNEILLFVSKAAELGFERIMFDDDLRDAFCCCDEHLDGFDGFSNLERAEIAEILNDILNPKFEELRRKWYEYKYIGLCDFAKRIENTVHNINPHCRIGICNSAKRCHDLSGRNPKQWLNLFAGVSAEPFVRLCGECYCDSVMRLAQSVGWHKYFDLLYSDVSERMLEITSVPSVSYRMPGTVWHEANTCIAATGTKTIHWAWTEEFIRTGLTEYISDNKDLLSIDNQIESEAASPFTIYIGGELGAYMPIDTARKRYEVNHDPITAFSIMSMVGLPVIPTPDLLKSSSVVLCSSYISRAMIKKIDDYVLNGGIVILDAIAAKSYRVYGGIVEFKIDEPLTRHAYEISPKGQMETIISDCPPASIYPIIASGDAWVGYDIEDNPTGLTAVIISSGKGKIVILAYDLSVAGDILLCADWREKMLSLFQELNVKLPAYWDGPPAVQCFYYGNMVALINYNTNKVGGKLVLARTNKTLCLNPMEIKFQNIRNNN